MTTKVIGQNTALKGLVLYATADNAVGVGVKGDTLVLWQVLNSYFVVLNKLRVKSGNEVFLKADVAQAHICNFSYSQDGKNWNPVSNTQSDDKSVIGDNLAWWSWGMKAGLMVRADSLTGDNTGTFDDFTLDYH